MTKEITQQETQTHAHRITALEAQVTDLAFVTYGFAAKPAEPVKDDLVAELRGRIEAQDTIISAMTHRLRFMENL